MSSSKSKKKTSRRSKRVTSTITPDVGELFAEPSILEPVERQSKPTLEVSSGKRSRHKAVSDEPLVDFSFSDEPFADSPAPQQSSARHSHITPVLFDSETDSQKARVSLLTDFWKDEEVVADEKEGERFNEFFTDSVHNTKARSRAADESLSKRIQVGLYPADADLLEELFLQSKAAGLKNVSRARILRVALRHFHTCWLNADNN